LKDWSQKIEQVLEERGVVINEQQENQKIKNFLKAFIKNKNEFFIFF
jgi:hypothetical protein